MFFRSFAVLLWFKLMKDLRIVFFGTPEFAVATLGSLLINGFNVVGVVTSPDKPSGRGRKITHSAVKIFSESNFIPVFQPQNLQDINFINNLKQLKGDIFIVVAFRMLPEEIWKMPPMGTVNLHASLLPHYRGAAPINHVLINGETKTGITTFLIDNEIDTGKILLREEVSISPEENAGDLHDKLMKLGARLVIETIIGLTGNTITATPQSQLLKPGEKIKLAPKIYPDDCIINWNKDSYEVQNFIRGLAPLPGAKAFLTDGSSILSFKIMESRFEKEGHDLQAGKMITDGKQFLKIACRKGFIIIDSLQLEGKRKMRTADFLRGFNISNYTVTTNQQA
jgi:methionyl-tRNA formyltransferase